jgi:hypothetical protein
VSGRAVANGLESVSSVNIAGPSGLDASEVWIPNDQELRRIRPRRAFSLLLAGAVLLLVGCTTAHKSAQDSAGSLPSDGDRTALCKFDTDIAAAGSAAQTPEQRSAVLVAFEPQFDQVVAEAPSAIKSDVRTLVDASRATMHGGGAASTDADLVAEAGHNLDRYCGTEGSSPK